MSTFRELVYMVNDELKLSSDDSYFTEDHIIFLLKKYRAALLYLKYITQKVFELLDESDEQEICVDVEVYNDGTCGNTFLRSTDKIPSTLDIGTLKISLNAEYAGMEIAWVSERRLRYVGHNKYLYNMVYAAKGNDGYLYIKSNNPQTYYLKKVKLKGAFEDPDEAAKYSCDSSEETSCDIMDQDFPIEESLITALIQSVVKELSAVVASPQDTANNASDDMADLQYYIKKNLKNSVQKKIDA